MKYLLLLLLLPFAATAQRDFDYTLYTPKARIPISNTINVGTAPVNDSLYELAWPRRIVKIGNTLKIINLGNTADCITYTLHFMGFSTDMNTIVYTDDRQETVMINPMLPLVIIGRNQYY